MYKLNNMNKLICVYGMRRCGNHGIINWLCSHLQEKVLWLNNITHPSIFSDKFSILFNNIKTFPDPLYNLQSSIFENIYIDAKQGNLITLKKLYIKSILLSCEDIYPDQNINYPELISSHRYSVYIIRDAFNCLASRIKYGILSSQNEYDDFVKKIKIYYQNYLKNKDNVYILYNHWFVNKEYRRNIIRLFDVPFTDMNLDKRLVPNNTSVFSRNSARNENVFDRWREYSDNKYMKQLLQDKKLTDMCCNIFDFNIK